MEVKLFKATREDAQQIIEMQIQAFKLIYEKYRDDETSPYKETITHILRRMKQATTMYFKIIADDEIVGAVRIRELKNKRFRVSPIFILPNFQGKGIAQKVFHMIEVEFATAKVWELDTILQESGHCYLYAKMGYIPTGREAIINDRMSIIYFEKLM